MKGPGMAGLLLGLVLLFPIVWTSGRFEANRADQAGIGRMRRLLKRNAALSRPEVLFRKVFEDIRARIGPHRATPCPAGAVTEWGSSLIASFPPGLLELWVFDGAGRVKDGPGIATRAMELAFSWIRGSWKGVYEVSPEDEETVGMVFGGFSWKELIARPDQVHSLTFVDRRMYAIWHFDPPSGRNPGGGALLKIDRSHFEEDFLVGALLGTLQARGLQVGFLDAVYPERSRLWKGAVLPEIRSNERSYSRSPEDVVPDKDGWLVFVPCLSQITLVGHVPRTPPPFLPLAAGLVVPVLFLSWLVASHGVPRTLALWTLLGTLVCIAGAIPLGISFLFWTQFERSRTSAILSESLKELEDSLTGIDRRFPMILRIKERRYGLWNRRLDGAFSREPEPRVFPASTRENFTLMEFRPDSAFSHPIEESKRWELAGKFDTIFLIDKEGRFRRDYSDVFTEQRRLLLMPSRLRMRRIRSLYERQGIIDLHTLKLLLYSDSVPRTSDEIIGFKGYMPVYITFLSDFSKGMISLYNSLRSQDPTGDEGNSSLVMGTLLEAEEWTNIHLALQNLRNFTFIGNPELSLYIFPGVVCDRTGKALMAFSIIHQITTLSAEYLGDFFRKEVGRRTRAEGPGPLPCGSSSHVFRGPDPHDAGSGPKATGGRLLSGPRPSNGISRDSDGIRFFAFSFFRNSRSFPSPFIHRAFRRFIPRFSPSRPLFSQAARIGGRELLLAGLSCRHIIGYYLFAVRPIKVLAGKLADLRRRFLLLALAMTLVFLALCLRLWGGVAIPLGELMNGVDAMERKEMEYRTAIGTGDEFEKVGEAFNRTLEGMAELEIARVVQQKLLPAAPAVAKPWTLFGFTQMTSQVGGDYYDFRVCPGGELSFVFGDVSGHGVSAALVVAMAKAVFSSLTRKGAIPPDELLKRMNQLLLAPVRRSKMMMTAIAGLALPNGDVKIANAGQCFPYLFPGPGSLQMQGELASMPLGISPKIRIASQSSSLSPGSHLIFFSDGFPEAVGGTDARQLGYPRLTELIALCWDPDPQAVIRNMRYRLKAFTGTIPWQDDVTTAILTRENPSPEAPRSS